ncbi:hypothetical protein V1478_018527 [Vespula squamosa]|uniref:Uncharacterized protein n=1 Tax=Vespula squamosa TaxID=30214 RepID=A0ABD1ZT09_VESSQ
MCRSRGDSPHIGFFHIRAVSYVFTLSRKSFCVPVGAKLQDTRSLPLCEDSGLIAVKTVLLATLMKGGA